MKKVFFALALLLSVSAYAQDSEEFEIAYYGDGKVVLNDGSTVVGLVNYSLVSNGKVRVTGSDGQEKKISINDVKEFFISADHFVKIPTNALAIGGSPMDIAILKTPEDYKIKIYEVTEQDFASAVFLDGPSKYPTSKEIRVLFPTMEKPKSAGDLTLMPFNKKVSNLVVDCPELNAKILNKEAGYKLGMLVTPQMKFDVYMKIAEEYQNCAK